MSREEHNLLTLDFWQDEVTYGGRTQPSGSVGCAALNINDVVIAELQQICLPLSMILAAVAAGQISIDTLKPAKDSLLLVARLLRDVPPFSGLNCDYFEKRIPEIFAEDYLSNAVAYVRAAAETGVAAVWTNIISTASGYSKSYKLRRNYHHP